MKIKAIVILSTLLLALGLIGQAAMQSTPATTDTAKTCACCNHDSAGKMSCCGKDSKCAKDGKDSGCCQGKDGKKCPMMAKMSESKDGKMSCCSGKDNKCPMSKMSKTSDKSKGESKGCCGGKCDRSQAGM